MTEGDSGWFFLEPFPDISLEAVAVVYKYLSVVGVVIERALKESTLAEAAKSSPLWNEGDLGMPPCVPVSRPPMTCPCANVECTIVYSRALRHSRLDYRPGHSYGHHNILAGSSTQILHKHTARCHPANIID